MSATLMIARHLWHRTFASRMIYLLGSTYVLLLIVASYISWQNFREDQQIKEDHHSESYEDFINNPDKHPHRMAHYGHYAFRETSVLSLFDPGLTSYMGNSIFLEAHVQNTSNFSNASLSTGLMRFGEVSIAMILQVLIPLLIIFLGFDSVSGAYENGTLKILFVQGAGWKSLVAGNSLGLLAILCALLVPLLIAFLVLSQFLPGVEFNGDQVTRILLLSGLYLAYFFLWSFVTVWLSAWLKNSKAVLVSLLGLWLVFIILMPRSIQSLGTLVYKTPSKAEFTQGIQEDILKVGDSHNANDPHFVALKDSVLKAHNVDSVEKLPFDYIGFQIQEGEKISTTIFIQHYDSLMDVYEHQNSVSELAGIINPFIAIRNLSMALTNTGYDSYVDFQKQAENYRFDFVSQLNSFHMQRVAEKELWGEIEEFHYQPGNLSQIIGNEFLSLSSVILWVLAVFICFNAFTKKLKVI